MSKVSKVSKVSNLTIQIPKDNEINHFKYPELSIKKIADTHHNKQYSWNDVKISNNLCKKIAEKTHCILI